jgi:hypothetical protein
MCKNCAIMRQTLRPMIVHFITDAALTNVGQLAKGLSHKLSGAGANDPGCNRLRKEITRRL